MTEIDAGPTVIDHPGTPDCPACKTDNPTVADVRRALVAESNDFYERRQPIHRAMHDAPKDDPNFGPLFDAYESLVAAGCYAWLLAAILRKLAQDHGEWQPRCCARRTCAASRYTPPRSPSTYCAP